MISDKFSLIHTMDCLDDEESFDLGPRGPSAALVSFQLVVTGDWGISSQVEKLSAT